jgi:hypothetical protein
MLTLNREKSSSKSEGNFSNFKILVQSKQSPNMRKFAQSGHPVPIPNWPQRKGDQVRLYCLRLNKDFWVSDNVETFGLKE